jgi:putative transposase
MEASDVRRLKELEAENAKLKRMYADLALENTAL